MTFQSRKNIVRFGALALMALPLAACQTDQGANRGVQSIHQPVVSHTAFTYDVQAGPDGGLTPLEARRLDDWFVSIGLGYGDQVALATDASYYAPALREGIADIVARHGMLVGEDSSAAAGSAPQGAVRLIVRRATARVPGCPDWSDKPETDQQLGASANFGCGVNGNLAAMIANPEDLVRGQTTDSDLRTATSNRAISTYREKAPTGSGDLKTLSGGN
ncbi:Pilus biogenesis CpaD-related protein [Sphingobium chlorophenolicum L-1]|uniref:Pilus biogenesis CpaD-related protein n=1 Tax=Sphingobium chlorophenolicum L-1 TaxID=690566 RepID=F6EX62_SPHCR|nr:CpaD family pilus assembly protein [Sphingobium chlorophenolicum]AEG49057.1 Pilus biogenesis CpaD-related protein [Sphingobium chlorophenolicum L-1]